MCAQPNTKTLSEGAANALARSEVYLFLARSFGYPGAPLDDYYQRAEKSAALLEKDISLQGLDLPGKEAVESQYVQTFGHTISSDYPPYETEYERSNLFIQSSSLGELASFYGAFGAQPVPGERLDHLETEIEFMYFLTYREAYAWQSGNQEGVSLCREGQRLFMEKHLGRWAPLFFQLLEKKGEGFYARLARAGAQWLQVEREELGAHPVILGEEAIPLSGESDALYANLEMKGTLCEVEE